MPREQPVRILSPRGVALAGVLHLPDEEGTPGGAVVICHGMMSYKNSPKHVGLARTLAERGIAALRFDFSGRGESEGDLLDLSIRHQVEECRAALALLRERGIGKIALVGSSLGGAVAILTTAEEGASALVTMAAVGRADLLPERVAGAAGLARWQRKGVIRLQGEELGWSFAEDARTIDVVAAAGRIRCPWLILHGERDRVIPVADALLLQRASDGLAGIVIIPGADHQFSHPPHREQVIGLAADFVAEELTPADKE